MCLPGLGERSGLSATGTAEVSWAQPHSAWGHRAAPGTFPPTGLFREAPSPGKVKHLL